ncbi:MAG: response regulator transcription factor [Saprospirales bacterium]|nr:response regulator transcription factor [Saprospirales bacterium]
MNNKNTSIPPYFSLREMELVRSLSEGLSSKQAADRLGITKNTVDTHRRNLLRKTGCNNSLQLVVRCVRWGIL